MSEFFIFEEPKAELVSTAVEEPRLHEAASESGFDCLFLLFEHHWYFSPCFSYS